jgi:hypothetical protein
LIPNLKARWLNKLFRIKALAVGQGNSHHMFVGQADFENDYSMYLDEWKNCQEGCKLSLLEDCYNGGAYGEG